MSITDSLKVLLWNNNSQVNGLKCISAFSMVFFVSLECKGLAKCRKKNELIFLLLNKMQ